MRRCDGIVYVLFNRMGVVTGPKAVNERLIIDSSGIP